MKLEVGMYVRTKEGYIEKICAIENEHIYTDEDYLSWYPSFYAISKASYNIIDLIEAGDYVNGFEVMEADWNNDDLEYEEGLAIPMYSSDDLDVIENWQPLKYMKIKTIVTKEQFESCMYKVSK